MQTYEVHPLATLIPQMLPHDFADLKDSIRRRGLRRPVALYQGKIVDGRNRYSAITELRAEGVTKAENGRDIELVVKPMDFRNEREAAEYVIDENLNRRHLTKEQKIAAIPKLYAALEGPAKERMRAGKKADDVDPNAALQEAGGTLASNEARVSGKTAEKVAKATGLSRATVERAVSVAKKGTPEVQEAMQAGKVKPSKAADIAKLPPAKQNAALARATGEKVPEPEPSADPSDPTAAPPSHLQAAFDVRSEIRGAVQQLRLVENRIRAICDKRGGEGIAQEELGVRERVEWICKALTTTQPHSVCPGCQGEKGASCDHCAGRGWVDQAHAHSFSDRARSKVYSVK